MADEEQGPESLVFYERLHFVDQVSSHREDPRDVMSLGHFWEDNGKSNVRKNKKDCTANSGMQITSIAIDRQIADW